MKITKLDYLKKLILAASSERFHASANPPTSITPQIAKANKATNNTAACNTSVQSTAFSPP